MCLGADLKGVVGHVTFMSRPECSRSSKEADLHQRKKGQGLGRSDHK